MLLAPHQVKAILIGACRYNPTLTVISGKDS